MSSPLEGQIEAIQSKIEQRAAKIAELDALQKNEYSEDRRKVIMTLTLFNDEARVDLRLLEEKLAQRRKAQAIREHYRGVTLSKHDLDFMIGATYRGDYYGYGTDVAVVEEHPADLALLHELDRLLALDGVTEYRIVPVAPKRKKEAEQ